MKRILVVEDEQAIREFVVINLNRAGYQTVEAASGEEALEIFNGAGGRFDIALLDITMPGMDGLTLCKELRALSGTMGIIMLTARTQEMDKVSGLMMGADDYVIKPFSPSELMARIDAIYRRVSINKDLADMSKKTADVVTSGEFSLNLISRTLSKNNEPIELTQVEFQIMEYFMSNTGVPLSRLDILRHVWGNDYYGDEKVVDVNVRRLRMKIEEDPSSPEHITTVWSIGYKWVP